MSDTSNYPRPTQEELDRAAKRTRSSTGRHEAIRFLPTGYWFPHLVGVIPRYPNTYEAWKALSDRSRVNMANQRAKGLLKHSRKGIGDGWAGRSGEIGGVLANAHAEATDHLQTLITEGYLEVTDDARDEAMGNAAIREALAIAVARDDKGQYLHSVTDRRTALRIVATFCKARPVAGVTVVQAREDDFLARLAAEEELRDTQPQRG